MSQVLGIPQTLAAFARLQGEAEVGEKVAEAAGGKVVAADMRARAPVDTGAMRNSITVRLTGEGAQVAVLVPYARFVEFGTRYMDAQPFMDESADAVGGKVGSVMATVFKRILR